ncbi:hypothetical protein SLE2022_151010 [Rubroshorea leprosula]
MNASCRSAIAVFFLLIITTTHALTGRGGYLGFINQFLAPQNAARYTVRMRPLVWDEKLARYARWYANQRRNDCALRHSNGPYGENIFWGSGDDWSPIRPRQWRRGYWKGNGTITGLIRALEGRSAGIILRLYGAVLRGWGVRG